MEENQTPNQSTSPANDKQNAASASTASPANASASHQTPATVSKTGRGLAGMAFLLSVASLGAVGWIAYNAQSLKNNPVQIQHLSDTQIQNTQMLRDAVKDQNILNRDYERLSQELATVKQDLTSLKTDYQSLTGNRFQWLINESEYTIHTTLQQLMINGNVQAAIDNLTMLQTRLNRFDVSELLSLKQALNEDLIALNKASHVDLAATSLHIDRLIQDIDALPLLMDNLMRENTPKIQNTPQTNNGQWYEKFWEDTKHHLSHVVQMRRLENHDAMMLAPDQIFFIRQNIKLRLMNARLALSQHHVDIYRNDLKSVADEVTRYFDTKSPTVKTWLDDINALSTLDIKTIPADALKNSLSVIRTYQNDRQAETILPTPTISKTQETPSKIVEKNDKPSAKTQENHVLPKPLEKIIPYVQKKETHENGQPETPQEPKSAGENP